MNMQEPYDLCIKNQG